jgi:hypothetical protein
MGMQTKAVIRAPKIGMKVILWALIAFYTFILPNATIDYGVQI